MKWLIPSLLLLVVPAEAAKSDPSPEALQAAKIKAIKADAGVQAAIGKQKIKYIIPAGGDSFVVNYTDCQMFVSVTAEAKSQTRFEVKPGMKACKSDKKSKPNPNVPG